MEENNSINSEHLEYKTIRFEDEDINLVPPIKNLKVDLFSHQLASIYQMEEREKNRKLDTPIPGCMIESNVGIFADMTGYGKSLSVIGMLIRDKMRWDLEEKYENCYLSRIYGFGMIKKFQKSYHDKLNCNLVIASQSLINQWKKELSYSNLKYCSITTRKQADNCEPGDFDVIISSPTMYNRFVSRFREVVWKRLIFDEPTHTRISAMKTVLANFYWFISATPDMLLWSYGAHRNAFITSLFRYDMDYNDFKLLIVKNNDNFVKNSYQIPPEIHEYHECHQAVRNMLQSLINQNVIDMVSAGNIEGAVKSLGGKRTDNIIDLVKQNKLEKLEEIEFKIQRYTRRNSTLHIEKWKKEKDRVEKQIEELENRFKNALNGNCTICLNRLEKPVMLSCCQNIFCGECILSWLDKKNSCPLCRAKAHRDNIIYIKNNTDKEKSDECKKDTKMSKQDKVIDLIQNKKDGKFIIFSSYDETFCTIRYVLEEHNISYAEVQGTVNTRSKKINSFKEGETQVIFLNSKNNGAGINLQEASDIILYHEMDENVVTQIIGRANRIGRKNKLYVHHLI